MIHPRGTPAKALDERSSAWVQQGLDAPTIDLDGEWTGLAQHRGPELAGGVTVDPREHRGDRLGAVRVVVVGVGARATVGQGRGAAEPSRSHERIAAEPMRRQLGATDHARRGPTRGVLAQARREQHRAQPRERPQHRLAEAVATAGPCGALVTEQGVLAERTEVGVLVVFAAEQPDGVTVLDAQQREFVAAIDLGERGADARARAGR